MALAAVAHKDRRLSGRAVTITSRIAILARLGTKGAIVTLRTIRTTSTRRAITNIRNNRARTSLRSAHPSDASAPRLPVPIPKFFQPHAGTKHMLQMWWILMYWEHCYTRATGMHWWYWAHFMVTVVRKWQWESLHDDEKALAVCWELAVYSGNSQASRSRPLCSYTEEKASPCTEIG